MPEECKDQQVCREDLIKRINQRMSTKSFISTIGTIVVVGGIISSIAYKAYSQKQQTTQEAIKEQTGIVRKADKKLTEIEVNQQHVMRKQEEFRNQVEAMKENQVLMLQEIIKIREHQTNDD